MSTVRMIPTSMLPEAKPKAPEKEIETARVENTNPDACPICNAQFVGAVANGHKVRMCLEHQIVMPTKDQ